MAPGDLAWRLGLAGRVPVFGRVGPLRRHVCADGWPIRNYGPGRDPRRTGGRCPATAVPRPRAGAGGGAPSRGGASHEAEGRGGARTGRAGLVGPGRRRLCVVRQIGDQLVPGLKQFLLVNDVVAVEDGAALVPGQEHGDPLGDVRADQVAGGGAATIVEEASRHPGRLAGGAPRRAPAPDGDAVAVEDERAGGVAACPPSRQGLGNGRNQDAFPLRCVQKRTSLSSTAKWATQRPSSNSFSRGLRSLLYCSSASPTVCLVRLFFNSKVQTGRAPESGPESGAVRGACGRRAEGRRLSVGSPEALSFAGVLATDRRTLPYR